MLQAAAKHEQAAKSYSHSLQQQSGQGGNLGADGKTFLVERCCEAYAAVADWQGLQLWLQDMKVGVLLTVAVCRWVVDASVSASRLCTGLENHIMCSAGQTKTAVSSSCVGTRDLAKSYLLVCWVSVELAVLSQA